VEGLVPVPLSQRHRGGSSGAKKAGRFWDLEQQLLG
jgi:hypothetical protein